MLAEWADVRSRWYQAHGLDPRWLESHPERFASVYQNIAEGVRLAFQREQARVLHVELDKCHGSCLLRHPEPQRIVAESLAFFHGQRLWLGDSVIMPNHVHLIVQPFNGWELEELLGSIKRWTSRLIRRWLPTRPDLVRILGPERNRPRLWQQESYDRIMRDEEERAKFRQYIADNPQVANCRSGEFLYQAREW